MLTPMAETNMGKSEKIKIDSNVIFQLFLHTMSYEEIFKESPLVLFHCFVANSARAFEAAGNEYFQHIQYLQKRERLRSMIADEKSSSKRLDEYFRSVKMDGCFPSYPDSSLCSFYAYLRCICVCRILIALDTDLIDRVSLSETGTWEKVVEWGLIRTWERGRMNELLRVLWSIADRKKHISCLNNRDNLILGL